MSRIEVRSEVTGRVWKLVASPESAISEEDPLLIVESMKMEIPVLSPAAGKVMEFRIAEGDTVEDGQVLVVIEGKP